MRRPALLLALALTAAVAVPALAADTAALPAPQTVTGTITAPVPANVTGGPRRAALASTSTNGVIGWYFTVAPETVGGVFDLAKGADPSGLGDVDVLFYSDPGDVANTAPTAVGTFATVGGAGEKGIVPEGAKTALVYITGGARVAFSYKADPATVLSLAAPSLDVTVAKGAPVRFLNDTTAPVAVLSDALDEFDSPLFDTGELAPGAAASVVLDQPGTYPFTAGSRTGTLTVTG